MIGKLLRFVKEIQGHMRLHSSGDRHEIRQQYFSLLWYKLVAELQTNGKEAIQDVMDLMDSYYLTKDDHDAIMELGLGSMDMERNKIDSGVKSAFTRAYNTASHPVPFMKASQVVAPKKKSKDRPDLEEAIEEDDSGADTGDDVAVLTDDEPIDLKKDKYIKAPKKKPAPKGKGKKAQKGDEDDEGDSDAKPATGRGKGKAARGGAAGGRGRGKK